MEKDVAPTNLEIVAQTCLTAQHLALGGEVKAARDMVAGACHLLDKVKRDLRALAAGDASDANAPEPLPAENGVDQEENTRLGAPG